MTDFETWLYRLIIGVLGLILWWGIQRLIKKFDELIESINKLTATSEGHQEQIKSLNGQITDQNKRINDHASRIRSLEIKRAECQHCHNK